MGNFLRLCDQVISLTSKPRSGVTGRAAG